MVRPFSGKAGQTIVKIGAKLAEQRIGHGPDIALVGRIEGRAVFEEELPGACRSAATCSAASDCATASPAGIVRDFNATTSASASGSGSSCRGTSISLHGAHARPRQHAREIGGAGEIVGNAAKQYWH